MPGRPYTAKERKDAVELVAQHGLAHAWRETGIPKPTLVRWCDEAGVERFHPEQTRAALTVLQDRAAMTRETLRLMLLEKAVDLMERIDEPHVEFKGKDADAVTYPVAPASAVQNYATSVAIFIDKYRLEIGEATSRGETNDITARYNDHENDALSEAIRNELARRANERASQPAVEVAESTRAEGTAD